MPLLPVMEPNLKGHRKKIEKGGQVEMPESQEIEKKPDFFANIKHRLSRGLIVATGSYVIIMIILMATNRTQFSADVFLLWMLMPVLFISIFTAILAELTWSISAHFAKKEKTEIKKTKE